jgi:Molybdopterin oxidoreductase Fe4S4 domain
MNFTRRDLLTWGGGAAAGLLLTPVPWKLLDDTSIWTQNWPWIPQPARGPVEVKNSFCALCPNGCGMCVRLAAGWPVGISGMPHHPVNRGALCPLGFGAHQLNWHPRRMRQVRHHGRVSSWTEALAAFQKACAAGPIAIVDGYPRRAASSLFQSFSRQHGAYGVTLCAEERALAPYESWSGVPVTALGYDLENVGTIVSFGAPLLDGWSAPGRFTRLWSERATGMADPQLRLIQVESSQSRTGACAWQRVSIAPGSEAALAAGLARVLREEHLAPEDVPMPPITPAEAAARSGLSVEAIRDLARTMVARGPVLAVSAEPEPAIAALNIVLGAVGARGGIVCRRKRAERYAAADSLTESFRAVLIDSSVPADFTPRAASEIFRFAAWEGGRGRTDWLLPAPGFLEELTDLPTAPASSIETYAVAEALAPPPPDVRSAAQFLAQVDPSLPPVEKVIHERCRQLFQARTGRLQREQSTAVSTLESPEAFEKELRNGAVWVGDPPRTGGIRCQLREWPQLSGAAPCAATWAAAWVPPVLPPLATKLFQESNLREMPPRSEI